MRRISLISCLLAVSLLGGCSALPFGHEKELSPDPNAASAQSLDPGLKIAVDVVMARLRGAEAGNINTVQDAAPEIYQLAAALMPPTGAKSSSKPLSPQQPRVLGELMIMDVETPMGRANVIKASYAPEDLAQPPKLPQARSLMYAVHIGSYRTAARALEGYQQIKSRSPEVLADISPRVERVNLGSDKGIYERLKAGPFSSRDEAQATCKKLALAGTYCAPADFTGRVPE